MRTVIPKHIRDVAVGDIIECPDGEDRTLSPENLKVSPDKDITVWGDSYHAGNKPVRVVILGHNEHQRLKL